MSKPDPASQPGPADPELDAALKAVLQIIFRDHPLQANQILVLAAELQRLGVHRLVEEHIGRLRQRPAGSR
ncbi:MAG TPA: hypothetical protein VIC28_03605 [Thermoanaerobaculia bacterium]